MSLYIDAVKTTKQYFGNTVVQIDETYFAIRQPDSGLTIAGDFAKMVSALNLNPAQIDLRKVTTTISSFTFRLLDKDGQVTALVGGDATSLIGKPVRIFLGQSFAEMDFSEYFELPLTYIQKCEHADGSYVFSSTEQTERMTRPIYAEKSALAVSILEATTVFTMRDDISDFPATGFLKVDDEFVSYTGRNLMTNQFTGVIRGELGSTPAAHAANTDCLQCETITDNPINILLNILISGGGGGAYDTLQDGLGISEDLIDIAEIEALRDELFSGVEYTLSLYALDSALKFLENQILMPNNLRFTNSINSKVTLAILDKARFVPEADVINEDTITKFPKWTVDGSKITNVIEVRWNYSEGLKTYLNRDVYRNEASIALYGAQTSLKFDFKGPQGTLGGQALVDDFGTRLLGRLSSPTPEVTVTTHIDKSLQTIGDKAYLQSNKIPASDGTLNFASDLEIVSRSINQTSGEVQFKLAFTSFTRLRSAYVAPSDLITSIVSQKKINVALGRSARYRVGWFMVLWDEINQVYCSDAPNKIVGFDTSSNYMTTEDGDILTTESGERILLEQDSTEDTIVFENNWTTPITGSNQFRIRFANYAFATDSQKRYAFASHAGADFADSKPTYKVTY